MWCFSARGRTMADDDNEDVDDDDDEVSNYPWRFVCTHHTAADFLQISHGLLRRRKEKSPIKNQSVRQS